MPLLHLLIALIAIGVMLAVSYTDLRERRIPNQIMYPALLTALLVAPFSPPGWQSALLGALLGTFVFTLPVFTFGKRGGIGDVKLAAFIGLLLGLQTTFMALAITSFLAGAVAILGILTRRWGRHTLIPFGPFLAVGGIFGLWQLYILPTLRMFL